MIPNINKKGIPVTMCEKCINVEVAPGEYPCNPNNCEIAKILSGTFQYLENLPKT